MRVLVVGTVPPPGGELARSLGAFIARELCDDEVEVLSPDARSAAHGHANVHGPLLALALLVRAKRFDAVVVRIERDVPLAERCGRAYRAGTLVLLGWALSRYEQVTIILDAPAPIPGGLGGRATAGLWRRASRIIVGSEADRKELLAAPGVEPARIELSEPPSVMDAPIEVSWVRSSDTPTREEVLRVVRARAARERAANASLIELGATSPGPLPARLFGIDRRSLATAETAAVVARALYRRGRRLLGSS